MSAAHEEVDLDCLPLRIDMGSRDDVAWALQRELIACPVVLRIEYDGEPVSKSRARFTGYGSKTRAYTPEKTRAAEERIAWLVKAAGFKEPVNGDKTYGLFAKFFCGTWQRRDVDNMLKLISDALTGIVWKDDSQVSEMSAGVQRGDSSPRSYVLVYETFAAKPPTSPCVVCGAPIRIYKSVHYSSCSSECARKARLKRVEVPCTACGSPVEYTVSGARRVKRPFCSEECRRSVVTRTKTCPGCNNEFTLPASQMRNRKFCSAECSAVAMVDATLRSRESARGTCVDCGGPTSKKTYARCASCNMRLRAS